MAIRGIRVACTSRGAAMRVYEDTNQAPTTYHCVRDPGRGWLVETVISTAGHRIDRTPAEPLPEWGRDEMRRALDDACGPG